MGVFVPLRAYATGFHSCFRVLRFGGMTLLGMQTPTDSACVPNKLKSGHVVIGKHVCFLAQLVLLFSVLGRLVK